MLEFSLRLSGVLLVRPGRTWPCNLIELYLLPLTGRIRELSMSRRSTKVLAAELHARVMLVPSSVGELGVVVLTVLRISTKWQVVAADLRCLPAAASTTPS